MTALPDHAIAPARLLNIRLDTPHHVGDLHGMSIQNDGDNRAGGSERTAVPYTYPNADLGIKIWGDL